MSRHLLKSTFVIGSITLLSRVLGFVRDMVLARMFGAGMGMDAFLVAFKIPNFMRRLFAEGAFSQAFVPILNEYKTHCEHDEVQHLVGRVTGTLAVVVGIITLLGVVFTPGLVTLFAPGFIDQSAKFDLTVDLLRITFPYIFFISLVSFASGILNSYGRFAMPAFAPVLLNLSLISGALFFAPYFAEPITALAWAVAFAGVIQLLLLIAPVKRLGLLAWPRWGWRDSGVQKILRLMGPAVLGSSVAQINLLLDTLIASFLITGSVSWLYYADRMVEFPLGVFGIALSTVILPSLSSSYVADSMQRFGRTLDWALRSVIWVTIPACLGLALLAEPILVTLFQYGEFSVHDTQMASLSLLAYAFGLPAFVLIKVLAPAYYARQDTRTPVRIAIRSMITNMFLNILFVLPMLYLDIEGAHAGLALATSISAYMNAFLLYRGLREQGVYQPYPGWLKVWWQALGGSLVLSLVIILGRQQVGNWYVLGGQERVTQLVLWIVLGMASYFIVLRLTGLRLRSLLQLGDENDIKK
ncbi:MAG: murein biosynthesis integral membrane protein MurJ [Gammaproteobacteria bacterium]|nr:murein biosynthesis integral membrane protein MurJ [Gammaproteobacteria bacterium]